MFSVMASLAALGSVTITTFLVVVLARAAWHKADRFLETVGFAQDYGIVPDSWVAPIVRSLALIEAGTVLALVFSQSRAAGGLIAAGLFAGYAAIMARAMLGGKRRIDCGCGGVPQVVSAFTLARNAALTALALCLVAVPATTVRPVEAAFAIWAGIVLVAIYAVLEKLASHIPYIRQEEF